MLTAETGVCCCCCEYGSCWGTTDWARRASNDWFVIAIGEKVLEQEVEVALTTIPEVLKSNRPFNGVELRDEFVSVGVASSCVVSAIELSSITPQEARSSSIVETLSSSSFDKMRLASESKLS